MILMCRYHNKNRYIKLLTITLIDGEKSSYQVWCKFYRYHLVITKISRQGLWIQDFACCDYNRTSAIFEGSDIYRFVGDVTSSKAHMNMWYCKMMESQQVRLGLSMCAICPKVSIQTHIRYDAFRQAERAWFKVAFLFGEWKKNPGWLVPRSVPRSGENPVVKKSQHKSPLIFFYSAPPFSGLALPT